MSVRTVRSVSSRGFDRDDPTDKLRNTFGSSYVPRDVGAKKTTMVADRVGRHETGLRLRPGLGLRPVVTLAGCTSNPDDAETAASVEPSVSPVASPTPTDYLLLGPMEER